LKGRGNGIIRRGVVIYSKAMDGNDALHLSKLPGASQHPVEGFASNRCNVFTEASAGDTQTIWASGDGLGS